MYKTTFKWDESMIGSKFVKNLRVHLNLGLVHDVAEVTLNNCTFSPMLIPIYTLEITDVLKAGDNFLEIKTTGCLRNRLVGYGQKKPLMPMGLIGPVSLDATYES